MSFKKVLIANRGDTAIRIIHACKEMGFKTVAVHSKADDNALHVKLADESVRIGEGPSAQSYLNMKALLAAAEVTKADAIHPGIGFLSENDKFASMVEEHGLIFIGPTPENIADFGSKITARQIMHANGVKVIPGTTDALKDLDDAKKVAQEIGYPFVLKGAWCGGGKGIRFVHQESELEEAFQMAYAEAEKFSSRVDMYVEKYIPAGKHIEFQIAADTHGNVIYLGERDCSLQRNNQKIWEEAPSLKLSPEMRKKLGEQVCNVMKAIKYRGVGTVEFLLDEQKDECYFMEMNTRLQVEHTITEEITGVDLVRLQLLIAAGDKLPYKQSDIVLKGHAIECRINAEDPETFAPSPLLLTHYLPPTGKGVRVESGAFTGYQMPIFYDNLLAKLIVYDENRELAMRRMFNALNEYVIVGPKTNIPLHLSLCQNDDIKSGNFNTAWLNKFLKK